MRRNVIVFLFALMMLFSSTFAIDTTPVECFSGGIISGGNTSGYVISGYNQYGSGCGSDVVIPDVVSGANVVRIEKDAFLGLGIRSIVLPKGLKSIGFTAFGKNSLTGVILPDGLEILDPGAFWKNHITSVIIPDSVRKIDYYVFYENVDYSHNQGHITGYVSGNKPLSEYGNNVGSMLNLVEDSTLFSGSNTSWTVSLTATPAKCFEFNTGTKTLTKYLVNKYPECGKEVEIPAVISGVVVENIGERAFCSVPSGHWKCFGYGIISVKIPETVKRIGEDAFTENKISHLELPDTVEYIGGAAFSYNKLKYFKYPNSLTEEHFLSGGGTPFLSDNKLESVDIPQKFRDQYGLLFHDKIMYDTVNGSLGYVQNYTFGRSFSGAGVFRMLPEIHGKKPVLIGRYAFNEVYAPEVIIPDTIKKIENSGLGHNKLKWIKLPHDLIQVDQYAFNANGGKVVGWIDKNPNLVVNNDSSRLSIKQMPEIIIRKDISVSTGALYIGNLSGDIQKKFPGKNIVSYEIYDPYRQYSLYASGGNGTGQYWTGGYYGTGESVFRLDATTGRLSIRDVTRIHEVTGQMGKNTFSFPIKLTTVNGEVLMAKIHISVNTPALLMQLDESKNSTIFYDATQYHRDGSCASPKCPQADFGVLSGSQRFDGEDDVIDFGTLNLEEADEVGSGISVCHWFKADAINGEHIVYNKEGLFEAAVQNGYYRYAWQPHWGWDGGNSFKVEKNQWYHACVTYDGHKQIVYKNGKKIYERNQTGNFSPWWANKHFCIGAREQYGRGCMYNKFSGSIDKLGVWYHALAPEDITMLYNEWICAKVEKFYRNKGVANGGEDQKMDCEKLQNLYNTLGGDTWKNKSGWLMNPDLSTWHGIKLKNNRVDRIDLPNNNLKGEISDWAEILPQKISIGIWFNGNRHITKIPDSWEGMPPLENLGLYSIGFDTLPDSWEGLPDNLKYIALAHNTTKKLPETWEGLPSDLRILRLWHNQISKIPDWSTLPNRIERLHLNNNNITSLPDSWEGLKNKYILRTLTLQHNEIEKDGVISVGKTCSFDGNNDYIRVQHSSDFDVRSVTLSAWVQPAKKNNTWIAIMGKCWGDNCSPIYRDYALYFYSPHEGEMMQGFHYSSSKIGIGHQFTLPQNEWYAKNTWHHVAVTVDSTGKISYYSDGVLKKTEQGSPGNANIGNDFYIGKLDNYFKGKMAGVRMYNRALSPDEVKKLVNTPDSVSKNGLVLYYDFSDIQGARVKDKSGRGNDGTMHGDMLCGKSDVSFGGLPSSWKGLPTSLKKLDLSHNKIQTLPDTWEGLPQLEVFALDHNNITTVPQAWQGLYGQKLEVLGLSHNNIMLLPWKFPQKFASVMTGLRLDNNYIPSLGASDAQKPIKSSGTVTSSKNCIDVNTKPSWVDANQRELNTPECTIAQQYQVCYQQPSQGLFDDCMKLVKLYQTLKGDTWKAEKKAGWLKNTDLSTWAGVGVQFKRVRQLKLDGLGTIGEINGSWSDIIPDNVYILSLKHNGIIALPDTWAGLPSRISDLFLEGNDLRSVPAWSTLPRRLRQLALSNNPRLFSGKIFTWEELPEELRHLSLSNVGMGDINFTPSLPQGLFTLDLSNNAITSFAFTTLPGSLDTLKLQNNQITVMVKGWESIQSNINNNLRHLDLSNNDNIILPDSSVNTWFGLSSRLEYLGLSNRSGNEASFFVLSGSLKTGPHAITKLPRSLRELHLRNHHITEIPDTWKVWKNRFPDLEVLDLGENMLKQIPERDGDWGDLPQGMKTLYLDNNAFIHDIPLTWDGLPQSMEILKLAGNYISKFPEDDPKAKFMLTGSQPTDFEMNCALHNRPGYVAEHQRNPNQCRDVETAFNCNVITDVPDVECMRLVDFFYATDGQHWKDTTGWLTGTQIAHWTGITVSGNHVTEIKLFDNQLNLVITASGWNTIIPQATERLLLGGNTANIATWEGLPNTLTKLNLSNTALKTLPNDGLPQHLKKLNLSNNKIKTIDWDSLPKSLTELDLEHNVISSEISDRSFAPKMEKLLLGYNLIPNIPSSFMPLGKAGVLKILKLDHNLIGKNQTQYISHWKIPDSLDTLWLHGNRISEIPSTPFGLEVRGEKIVEHVNLSDNCLSPKIFETGAYSGYLSPEQKSYEACHSEENGGEDFRGGESFWNVGDAILCSGNLEVIQTNLGEMSGQNNQIFWVVFNNTIKPQSLIKNIIITRGEQGSVGNAGQYISKQQIISQAGTAGEMLTFRLPVQWEKGKYTISLKSGIQDVCGSSLSEEKTYTFEMDTTPQSCSPWKGFITYTSEMKSCLDILDEEKERDITMYKNVILNTGYDNKNNKNKNVDVANWAFYQLYDVNNTLIVPPSVELSLGYDPDDIGNDAQKYTCPYHCDDSVKNDNGRKVGSHYGTGVATHGIESRYCGMNCYDEQLVISGHLLSHGSGLQQHQKIEHGSSVFSYACDNGILQTSCSLSDVRCDDGYIQEEGSCSCIPKYQKFTCKQQGITPPSWTGGDTRSTTGDTVPLSKIYAPGCSVFADSIPSSPACVDRQGCVISGSHAKLAYKYPEPGKCGEWTECTIAECESGYILDGDQCHKKVITQTGECIGLPANAVYVDGGTGYSILQNGIYSGTIHGYTWTPALTGVYQAIPTSGTCQYTCDTNNGYKWEDGGCVPILKANACTGFVPAHHVLVGLSSSLGDAKNWEYSLPSDYQGRPCEWTCEDGYHPNIGTHPTACVKNTCQGGQKPVSLEGVWTGGGMLLTGNQTWKYNSGTNLNACEWGCMPEYKKVAGQNRCQKIQLASCGVSSLADIVSPNSTQWCGAGGSWTPGNFWETQLWTDTLTRNCNGVADECTAKCGVGKIWDGSECVNSDIILCGHKHYKCNTSNAINTATISHGWVWTCKNALNINLCYQCENEYRWDEDKNECVKQNVCNTCASDGFPYCFDVDFGC